MFSTKSRKSELHYWILRIRITLITKFQLKPTILIFGAKFAQKGYFRSKTAKVNSTIEFYLFKVVQSFSLNWPIEILMNWQFWFFIRKFVQTAYFPSKTQKVHFCVHPLSWLTILNFSAWRPTDTAVFNVSSRSSRRDKVFYIFFKPVLIWIS